MDTDALETGSLIREYRKKKGLTQGELGEKIGVTASAIMRYELGQRGVTLDIINRLASALGCDPYSLMSFDMASEAIFDRISAIKQINEDCEQLTNDGVKLVAEVARLAADSPRYRATVAPQPTPPAPEGTDTTPASDAPETPPEGE